MAALGPLKICFGEYEMRKSVVTVIDSEYDADSPTHILPGPERESLVTLSSLLFICDFKINYISARSTLSVLKYSFTK